MMQLSYALFITAILRISYAAPLGQTEDFNATDPQLSKRFAWGLQTNCAHDVAISFDDGPYYWTEDASNIFRDNQAKTSFFVNGNNYGCIYDEDNVQRLRRAYEAGHLIASHTWSHPSISTLNVEALDRQIQLLEDALWKILGVVPAVLRPPFGDIPDWALQHLNQRWGLTVVTWSDDSGDAVGRSPAESSALYADVGNNWRPRNVLNHETIWSTVFQVIPPAVSSLKWEKGKNLQTVAECLNVEAYKVVGSYGTRDSTWTCEGKPGPGQGW